MIAQHKSFAVDFYGLAQYFSYPYYYLPDITPRSSVLEDVHSM
ncbi:hypothetical protein [Desulfovibrio inopinatus]|nr:hypothetical protein [Desulfovibrio inopinatus]